MWTKVTVEEITDPEVWRVMKPRRGQTYKHDNGELVKRKPPNPYRPDVVSLPSGSTYEGDWQKGVPHGDGKLTLPNGDEYEGQFTKGKRQGTGKYTWVGGNTYEGRWHKDAHEPGPGKFFRKDHRIVDDSTCHPDTAALFKLLEENPSLKTVLES